VNGLILPRKERDKLGVLHEQFLKSEIESYVVIAVKNDGTCEVNFDLHEGMHMPGLNKIGGGLTAAYNHVVQLAIELDAKQKHEASLKKAN
jgi:hypothetical protein